MSYYLYKLQMFQIKLQLKPVYIPVCKNIFINQILTDYIYNIYIYIYIYMVPLIELELQFRELLVQCIWNLWCNTILYQCWPLHIQSHLKHHPPHPTIINFPTKPSHPDPPPHPTQHTHTKWLNMGSHCHIIKKTEIKIIKCFVL